MKIKVNDLYNLSLGLADLSDKELPISTSLKLQRNQKNVSEELISTDKVRQKIIGKYKEKDLGQGYKIKEDKWDVYNKEIDELMNQDIDLDLNKIDIKDLGDISVKPRTLMFIETILKEEETEK